MLVLVQKSHKIHRFLFTTADRLLNILKGHFIRYMCSAACWHRCVISRLLGRHSWIWPCGRGQDNLCKANIRMREKDEFILSETCAQGLATLFWVFQKKTSFIVTSKVSSDCVCAPVMLYMCSHVFICEHGFMSITCLFAEFSSELSECTEDEMKTFNEDIVCSHGICHHQQ